jgi:hypothetical protein
MLFYPNVTIYTEITKNGYGNLFMTGFWKTQKDFENTDMILGFSEKFRVE